DRYVNIIHEFLRHFEGLKVTELFYYLAKEHSEEEKPAVFYLRHFLRGYDEEFYIDRIDRIYSMRNVGGVVQRPSRRLRGYEYETLTNACGRVLNLYQTMGIIEVTRPIMTRVYFHVSV